MFQTNIGISKDFLEKIPVRVSHSLKYELDEGDRGVNMFAGPGFLKKTKKGEMFKLVRI